MNRRFEVNAIDPRSKILVTGFPGQLASALKLQAGDAPDWKFTDAAELDITDAGRVKEMIGEGGFDVVMNAAAYTAVDKAEEEQALASRVNALGPRILAEACRDAGSRLIHVSTDFVFDGTACSPIVPDAPVAPISEYGRSKLAGEEAVLEILGDECLIVRTAWVYSTGEQNFVATMLRLMRNRSLIRVVADQIGTPTWAGTLAGGLIAMSEAGARGIHHLTDSGVASWYDFAVAIYELSLTRGLLSSPVTIEPISSSEYPTAAARPAYSVLDKSSAFEILGQPTPHWRTSLANCLADWDQPESTE